MEYLGAIPSPVDRDGFGEVRSGLLECFPGVGCHQLAQLAGLAESQSTQAMLNALRLQPQKICEGMIASTCMLVSDTCPAGTAIAQELPTNAIMYCQYHAGRPLPAATPNKVTPTHIMIYNLPVEEGWLHRCRYFSITKKLAFEKAKVHNPC